MKVNNHWLIIGSILGMLVISLVLYPGLPDELPTQWGFDGQVNSTAPKWIAVLMMPGVATAVGVSMYILPYIDPRRESYKKFVPSYERLRVAIVTFLLGLHIIMLTQYDNPQAVIKLVLFGVALLLAVVGNEMGRIHQTWFVGFRTPWTLADERVWRKTHRVGARYMFGMGVMNMLLVLLVPMPLAGILLIVSAVGTSLGIAAYSYILYRQLNVV